MTLATPSHPDATGYLTDLAKEVGQPWFSMVCDLVTVGGVSAPNEPMLEDLRALIAGKASYLGMKPAAASGAKPGSTTTTVDFLDELSGFVNFKRLEGTLRLEFTKRITIVFGANGSGKSSVCKALKLLANQEKPVRPLQNVRKKGSAAPAFAFKFKSDSAPQTWSHITGYGTRRGTVKYFDADVAIRNVKAAVEPGRVVVVAPFRLGVFERAKGLTTAFRDVLQKVLGENSAELALALETIRKEFAKFTARPLASIDDKTVAVLPGQVKLGEGFAGGVLLAEKQAAAAELEKALSEEGLKLLKAEHRETEAFLASIDTLLASAAELWAIEPAKKTAILAAKQVEQEVLAKALIPKDSTLDGLLDLLRASAPLCKMDDAAGHECPLCKRALGAPEVELFGRYHNLLSGKLERDIGSLKRDIAKAGEHVTAVGTVDRKAWDKYSTLPASLLAAAKAESDLIIANCDLSKEPTTEARAALGSLRSAALGWAIQLAAKGNAIEAASKGREELVERLAALRAEIEPIEYAQAIAGRLDRLKEVQRLVDDAASLRSMLSAFTPLLKKITDKAKEAHEKLVVADFEVRLNAEYKALTEKEMAALGVVLAPKGADATVTVLSQVGGQDIQNVLSEGEQRVHALALFFAELETCPQSVLVFDDPVSSFDYNYIFNYCARLRDFARNHPGRQIVVLTHNWEFFVQLQLTLNSGSLNGELSVQVLENCSNVADYSEKADVLKREIEAILSFPAEPTKAQKETLAGKMRRLVESVVNTHVFADQRHQFKQKRQAVSTFHEFTKLIPLLPTEATELGDLYAKLSVTEHDDPRTAYVNADKATFQARYDRIKGVETAVIGRK